MIQKKIHYCWFGKAKKPKLIVDCIQSWKMHLPDYEIVEWNEENTTLNHSFAQEAYRLKKWAFVSDYVRLKVLFENGGIYLDTDMMVVKSFDSLLNENCFLGYEDDKIISAGIIGCAKNNSFIKKCLDFYDTIEVDKAINFYDIAIPLILTSVYNSEDKFKKEVILHPISFFYPLPNAQKNNVKNWQNYVEPSTFAVHLWNASWVDYDEFYYLRNRKYLKAVPKIFQTIFVKRSFNLYYFKRIYTNFIQSLS